MAKSSTVFVCSNCGYESAKWLGKCPSCNEWNSFYEEKAAKESGNKKGRTTTEISKPMVLNSVEKMQTKRVPTGYEELDRVLGGGLVKGSLILLGGEPRYWQIYFNFTNM